MNRDRRRRDRCRRATRVGESGSRPPVRPRAGRSRRCERRSLDVSIKRRDPHREAPVTLFAVAAAMAPRRRSDGCDRPAPRAGPGVGLAGSRRAGRRDAGGRSHREPGGPGHRSLEGGGRSASRHRDREARRRRLPAHLPHGRRRRRRAHHRQRAGRAASRRRPVAARGRLGARHDRRQARCSVDRRGLRRAADGLPVRRFGVHRRRPRPPRPRHGARTASVQPPPVRGDRLRRPAAGRARLRDRPAGRLRPARPDRRVLPGREGRGRPRRSAAGRCRSEPAAGRAGRDLGTV
jgi:hypothetical protein